MFPHSLILIRKASTLGTTSLILTWSALPPLCHASSISEFQLQYVDSDVEDNLEELANKKQKDEAAALTEQRRNQKDSDGLGNGQLVGFL